MSKPTPSYPGAVWDGTTADRLDYQTDHIEPRQRDYDRIVEEMRAVQTDLRTYGTFVFQIPVADGAGDTTFTVPFACKVIDVFAMKTSANGSTSDAVTVKNNAGSAITNAMSLNINDQLLARATSINDATQTFTAGQTLTVTAGHTTSNACVVNVVVVKQ